MLQSRVSYIIQAKESSQNVLKMELLFIGQDFISDRIIFTNNFS